MKDFYRSGELARICHCSADTLRHYERLGLIERPIRSSNGYRQYRKNTFERVKLIQAALSIGFTLKELSRILGVRDDGGIPCKEVRELAETKLRELQAQINQMIDAEKELQKIIHEWDSELQKTKTGKRAALLEQLSRKKVFTKRIKENLKRERK